MGDTVATAKPGTDKGYSRRAARRMQWGSYLFVLPAVAMFLVFIAYPVLWVVTSSLETTSRNGVAHFAWLTNYATAITDPAFWLVMRNMLYWAVTTIPIQMLIGGTLAYAIERYTNRSKTFFRTAFFIPVVTNVAVIAIVWEQMYAPYYGIIEALLNTVGIHFSGSLVANPNTTIFALILVNIWEWTGFSMIMYVAGINNIPQEIYDAAKIDGATGWALARHVLVPMLSSVTKALLLLGIIGTLQTFPIVYLMTGGGPDHASEVFGTYIFKTGFVLNETGYASALSVIVLVLAFILTFLQITFLGSEVFSTNKGE